jgi:hypothetical protein
MATSDHPDFRALDPFFRIIEEGVAGLVDGERYFEMLAEDVVFEYTSRSPATRVGSKDDKLSRTSTARTAVRSCSSAATTSRSTVTGQPV